MKKSILDIFNKFAGREVPLGEADPAIREMERLAAAHGMILRVWFPGTIGTKDLRRDRINARVEAGPDGKLRLGRKFSIG